MIRVAATGSSPVRPSITNGTHSAIAYAGQLCGLESVSDAMAHTWVGAFARRVMLEDLRAMPAVERVVTLGGRCPWPDRRRLQPRRISVPER